MILYIYLCFYFIIQVFSQPPQCSCQTGQTYTGHEIASVPVLDNLQCCGICSTTSGCKYVVLETDANTKQTLCKVMGSKAVMQQKKGATSCTLRYEGQSPKPKPPPRPQRKLPKPQPPTPLPNTFPTLSTRDPRDEGFAGVVRSGTTQPLKHLMCFEDHRKALATNHWWVPAVLGPNAAGKNYVTQLPYVLNLVKEGIEVGYPWLMAMGNIVQHIINRHWIMSSKEAKGYCISRNDELTATFKWGTEMESTIVRGSPYITVRYHNSNAVVGTTQGIRTLYVDGEETHIPDGEDATFTAHRYSVVLRDSDEQWTVYVPPKTKVKVTASPATFQLESVGTMSGVIRLALVNNCTTGKDNVSPHCPATNSANEDADPYIGDYEEAINQGSNVCTEAAVITTDKVKEGRHVIYNYKDQKCWNSEPDGLLTMIALPHQLSLLPCDGAVRSIPSGGHRNLRGHCLAVQSVGHRWIMFFPEQPIDWIGHPDKDKIPVILEALKGRGNDSDMNFDLPWDMQAGMLDPYNAGKLLSKMGRLVLIADQLNENEIANRMLERLKKYLSLWLDHGTKNRLIYDTTWGGVISCGCQYIWIDIKPVGYPICANNASKLECPTLRDPNFDFGNAYYNDHHFHYGYHIYASAVVAKFDSKWAQKYNQKVLTLIRDIANPSPDDPYFTTFRYFDWFVGHSWALGIVSDPNGKNQESTSEAVNAWYGIYLYGEATQNELLQTIGESLLYMEVHSTNYYWHVPSNIPIYPKAYDHTMVGILHDMLIEHQTYFGQAGFFVHGIQLLPITPVVHLMFHPFWVQDAVPKFLQHCKDPFCTDSGFITFAIAELAMVDKDASWAAALKLPDGVYEVGCAGGNGNSRTNTLYFISAWGNHRRARWPSDTPVCVVPPSFASTIVDIPVHFPRAKKGVSIPEASSNFWKIALLVILGVVGGVWLILRRRVRHASVMLSTRAGEKRRLMDGAHWNFYAPNSTISSLDTLEEPNPTVPPPTSVSEDFPEQQLSTSTV